MTMATTGSALECAGLMKPLLPSIAALLAILVRVPNPLVLAFMMAVQPLPRHRVTRLFDSARADRPTD